MNNIETSNLKGDFHRDVYWGTIYLKSETKEVKILVCASHEFLTNELKKFIYSDNEVQEWFKNNVISKWKNIKESDLTESVVLDVYATTEDGRVNGELFLKSKLS